MESWRLDSFVIEKNGGAILLLGNAGHPHGVSGRLLGLVMLPGGHIRESRMSEVDMIGTPCRGSIRPAIALAAGVGLNPEKCQLKAVRLSVVAFKVAGIVPPVGTLARVRPVIGRKHKIAGSLDS